MHSPAGTNHHQAPRCSARLFCAQNRMVPQFQSLTGVMPMNARVTWLRTANVTVPTNPAAMIAQRLGSTSAITMRHVRSPVARAASTKSRRRSERVWARSTRAPHAQPVAPMTRATVTPPALGSCAAMMMMSGSCGMTRNTFDRADSVSSPRPPTKPAVTPTTTPSSVAPTPAMRPTTSTPRVPTMICDRMSRPVWSVPSQWAADGEPSRSVLTWLGS